MVTFLVAQLPTENDIFFHLHPTRSLQLIEHYGCQRGAGRYSTPTPLLASVRGGASPSVCGMCVIYATACIIIMVCGPEGVGLTLLCVGLHQYCPDSKGLGRLSSGGGVEVGDTHIALLGGAAELALHRPWILT